MKRHQLIGSVFLLILGIFVCSEAQKLEIGRITRPGPGFFPFWLGVAMTIVSIALVIECIRERAERPLSSRGVRERLHWEKIFISLIALLFYAFFLRSLGYLTATFLLMFLLFWVIGSQRWLVGFFSSVVTSLFTYTLFKLWLQVQLPRGLWGF